jgi:hypothetical protein
MLTLAEEIKKYKTKKFIDFLHKEEKNLEKVFGILENQEVNGRDMRGMPSGLAKRFVKFSRECRGNGCARSPRTRLGKT